MSSSLSLMFLSPKPSVHCSLTPPQFRRPILVYNHNLKPTRFAKNGNTIRSVPERNQQHWVSVSTELKKPRWETVLETAASLYPFYVTGGAIAAWYRPSAFSWVVERAPGSYSLAVGFIMFAMGLTLELADLFNLMMQRPLSILFGCAAQYSIMPLLGMLISKFFGLSPSLSVGLILLACCPGGTASNVVTLIAKGDVPLSIVMTTCTTLGAVILTPILVKVLAGTFVPVDALKLSISTLQLVVAPILLGSYIQRKFPATVKSVLPFAPLSAILVTSLLTCSIVSENVHFLKTTMAGEALPSNLSFAQRIRAVLSGELGVIILSVALLHTAGFFVGCRFQGVTAKSDIDRGWDAKFISGSGTSINSFHFTNGSITLSHISCADEHTWQQFGIHLETN